MNECYLCRRPLENFIDETTANHEEHIIPQAIGGQLTAKDILCKECGGEKYLGGQIDKPFSNMFLLITERLDIKRDRKTRPVALTGKLKLFNGDRVLDVNLRENILANRRPEYTVDHVKKSVRIFANKAIAKDYKRKVEREVRKISRTVRTTRLPLFRICTLMRILLESLNCHSILTIKLLKQALQKLQLSLR